MPPKDAAPTHVILPEQVKGGDIEQQSNPKTTTGGSSDFWDEPAEFENDDEHESASRLSFDYESVRLFLCLQMRRRSFLATCATLLKDQNGDDDSSLGTNNGTKCTLCWGHFLIFVIMLALGVTWLWFG